MHPKPLIVELINVQSRHPLHGAFDKSESYRFYAEFSSLIA